MIPHLPSPKDIASMVTRGIDASVAHAEAIDRLAEATNRHAAALEEQNQLILAPVKMTDEFAVSYR